MSSHVLPTIYLTARRCGENPTTKKPTKLQKYFNNCAEVFSQGILWCLIISTLPILNFRVFHKLSKIQESQYCQLHFGCAFQN